MIERFRRAAVLWIGTIFQDHKISITEWVEQLLQIISFESSSLASKNGRNSFTTTKYWNAKLFTILEEYQDNILLHGNIEIDETYYHVIHEMFFKNRMAKNTGVYPEVKCALR